MATKQGRTGLTTLALAQPLNSSAALCGKWEREPPLNVWRKGGECGQQQPTHLYPLYLLILSGLLARL